MDVENTEGVEVINDEEIEESLPDGYIYIKSSDLDSTEAVEVIDTPEAAASNMSYNMAVIFVLSMIVGLLVFSCLSRRWNS